MNPDTNKPGVALVIPTLNPGPHVDALLQAIRSQTLRPREILVIDSSSTDGSVERLVSAGATIHRIPGEQFDHGQTRQLAVDRLPGIEFIVFITQDAIFANEFALEKLIEAFSDRSVAAAYGRQLPAAGANPIEAHSRLFNYPAQDRTTRLNDAKTLGIKAAFLSNSFAAYRVEALFGVGGFPRNIIFGEDMYVAAKLLLSGWAIHYRSEAVVRHSHAYTMFQDFARSFDVGVFHSREPWLIQSFGRAEAEGTRFLRSEIAYLFRVSPWRIPEALIRTAIKYTGYRLGRLERVLPISVKSRIGLNKRYWHRYGTRVVLPSSR